MDLQAFDVSLEIIAEAVASQLAGAVLLVELVLKHYSKSHIRLPSTLCAALSSLSVTPLIFQ